VRINHKIGQIYCSLGLSDLYRETNRPADALQEALTAFLVGSGVGGAAPDLALERLVSLRKKIGQNVLESIAKPVIQTFPAADQGKLLEALKMTRVTPGE
jgi:hypothetical protein